MVRFRSIAKSYFRRADGVLLLYDVTCESSFLNVREWVDMIEVTWLTDPQHLIHIMPRQPISVFTLSFFLYMLQICKWDCLVPFAAVGFYTDWI